jgi:hypothetical protein
VCQSQGRPCTLTDGVTAGWLVQVMAVDDSRKGVNDAFTGEVDLCGASAVTSTLWKCSSTLPPDGWTSPDFDASAWPAARARSTASGFASFPVATGVPESAQWIWSPPSSGKSAYCRITLPNPLYKA